MTEEPKDRNNLNSFEGLMRGIAMCLPFWLAVLVIVLVFVAGR